MRPYRVKRSNKEPVRLINQGVKGVKALKDLLLEVDNLRTCFNTSKGLISVVNDISFKIRRGESVGMVGESGCGKSVTSLSIMRLIFPPGKIDSGRILLEGEDLVKKSQKAMRSIRGNRISMIFQEPMTSLNPVYTVGMQIAEPLRLHQSLSRKDAQDKTVELLNAVGIPLPEQRVKEYPHQLSGGMRQRVMIAMALSCNPSLLIADEPTTALDVTIQAQILELLKEIKHRLNMSILIITHDLGIIAELAERVLVVYAGRVVEEAEVKNLLKNPLHPYTQGLLASIPRLDSGKKRLHVIEGNVPVPGKYPTGCPFHPRCPFARNLCRLKIPPFKIHEKDRMLSCWIGSAEYGREAEE